jgi:hypothetical protein
MLFVGGVQQQRREENLPRDVGTHRLPKIAHVQANATPDDATDQESIHARPDIEALVQANNIEALVQANSTDAFHSTSNGTPNVVESLVRTNDRQAVVHATTDGNPNVVEALLRAIIGSADNSEPDAAPDDSDAHVQAILGKADNSEPYAAPDHSSADRAADRALHTNMCSCRCGELY